MPSKLEQIKTLIAELEAEQSENKEEAVWPKEGEQYFFIDSNGEINGDFKWVGDNDDFGCKNFLGIYPTESQAKKAKEHIKHLWPTERWVPEYRGKYCFWNGVEVDESSFFTSPFDKRNFAQGNCFECTPEGKAQCEAYGKAMMELAEEIIKSKS